MFSVRQELNLMNVRLCKSRNLVLANESEVHGPYLNSISQHANHIRRAREQNSGKILTM
jgi:hypothetical protein